MKEYVIYVAGKQRGGEYTNLNLAIQNGEVIARANRRVFVYELDNGHPGHIHARWQDGKRVK